MTGLIALLLVVAAIAAACSSAGPETAEQAVAKRQLTFDGPENGAFLNAEAVKTVEFAVTASGGDAHVDDVMVLLDDEDVTADATVDASSVTYTPGSLDEGDRTVAFALRPPEPEPTASATDGGTAAPSPSAAPSPAPEPEVLQSWTLAVDTTSPTVEIGKREGAAIAGSEYKLSGTTEPGATVTADGSEVAAGADGAFEVVLASAADGEVEVVSTDAAGNTTSEPVRIVTVPSRVELPEIRAVHVSFYGWASSLKPPVLQMLDEGKINAVQLDLKDEAGQIAYTSQVPLAQEMGANLGIWDLEEAVAELHAKGAPVIGRIVAFADPVLVKWAWANGNKDMVIQLPDGSAPYTGKYAGFSNFTNPEVIEYNLAIAEEAAKAGVDQILWDYIRRPDGGLSNFNVPGLTTTPEEAIIAFTRMADERLAPYGIQHGASVFGIAADRPTQIGQDIPGMADYLDYVSPMIYPSHWGPGEYDVADPNRQPYDIISATLGVWEEVTAGKRARVIPWLEDTSYRAYDRPFQVREQIRATRDMGIKSFVMWDPNVKYTNGAYDVVPPEAPATEPSASETATSTTPTEPASTGAASTSDTDG